MGSNSRSTVGTATEIITYLRLLFSRFGFPFIGPSFYFSFNHPEGMCQSCQGIGKKARVNLNLLLDRSKTIREGAITHPEWKVGGWNWREIISIGLFNVDRPLEKLSPSEMDMLLYTEPIPVQKEHGSTVYAKHFEGIARRMERLVMEKAEEQSTADHKNAYQRYFDNINCDQCNGSRYQQDILDLKCRGKSIAEVLDLTVDSALEFFTASKISKLLKMMQDVGLGYLKLGQSLSTLSGGESQRLKLASELHKEGNIYVMDEPTTGLHMSDIAHLYDIIKNLTEHGNTVIVIEHNLDLIRLADWIIDMGPEGGKMGGEVIFEGVPEDLVKQTGSHTGRYLKDLL